MLKTARLFCVAIAALLLCLGATLPAVAAANLDVRAAIVLDMKTGKVLYEQDADRRIPPASLTKIISMLIAMDKVRAKEISLRDRVRISRNAAYQGGSKMHIRAGERVELDDLLMGMAVSSGNDASMAVAEYVGGSGRDFVRLMNAKARQLGMNNTSFKNPNGLPAKGQITTARDMSLLARHYLRSYPEALRYHKTRTLTHRGRTTTNKNPLLGVCPGADGLKTGWINASGYNIISTVERGGTRLLAVILGAPTSAVRSEEIRRLIESGFEAQQRGVSVASVLGSMRPAVSHATASVERSERKAQMSKRSGKSQKMAAEKKKTSRKKAKLSSATSRKKNAAAAQSTKKSNLRAKSSAAQVSAEKKAATRKKALAEKKSSKKKSNKATAQKSSRKKSSGSARADASRTTRL